MQALANEPSLVDRAQREPHAFGAIYDHYFPQVFTYMRYRVRDAHVADDLTAQVFERALSRLKSYHAARAPFGAWLFGIARHVIENYRRAQRYRAWLPFDSLADQAGSDEGPAEVAARHEEQERLLAAVARLSDRERDIIGLKFAARLTNRRIAEISGLSESNVAVILFRAMQKLRADLSPAEAEYE